jgi:hypothetical protein
MAAKGCHPLWRGAYQAGGTALCPTLFVFYDNGIYHIAGYGIVYKQYFAAFQTGNTFTLGSIGFYGNVL